MSHSLPRRNQDSNTYLLSQAEDLEALKVGQVLPPVGALSLLDVVALSPFAVDLVLLPQLPHGAGAGSTGELRDDEVGEGGLGERKDVTGDDLLLFGGRTINQDLFAIFCQNHIFPSIAISSPIFPFSVQIRR